MSNRLAFQTQLASIMEVLANAAVAEICKLVDDDYAVVSLQMSQCQRENRALKRKLHLLELKMARSYAERRLALSGGGRPRVNVNHTPAERFRVTSGVSSGAVFDSQVDMGLWPGEAPSGERSEELTHPSTGQDHSPDVELVEPQVAMVKEEGQETEAELDDDVHLIGEDGVAEHVPRGAPPQPPLPRLQPNGTRPPGAPGNSSSTRGAEVSGSSSSPPPPPPLKAELGAARGGGGCLLQAPPPPQGFDDAFCNGGGGAPLFVGGVYVGSAEPRRSSYSSSSSSYPPSGPPALPSTSSSSGGWPRAELGGFSPPAKPPPPPAARERLFVCSYCGKAFNRPKKVEIHQRIHTGERPFRCPTCGKRFSEAGNLKKHQRVHTGERPYYCRLCGKGFAWVRNLKTHQQKNHPDAYVEDDEAGGAGGPLAEQGWPHS